MSYNTRRSGGGPNMSRPRNVVPQGVMNNFISGGQLATKNVPPVQQRASFPPNTPSPIANQTQTNFRPAQPLAQAPQISQSNAPMMVPDPQTTEIKVEEIDKKTSKKPVWATKAGKISKKERLKRRNERLSKILQPKNAVMILNELVKDLVYTVVDTPGELKQYTATVQIEGAQHVGIGRSKMEAKNIAAENALKHIVKTRQLSLNSKDEDGDEKMEESPNSIPWQHVASFALYKLINAWGEDFTLPKANLSNMSNQDGTVTGISNAPAVNKPAKKLPENAASMNPLMLVNQMLPQAEFEEIGHSGNPPNIYFTYQCTVDGKVFKGTGSSKKAAKKVAAFAVCKDVLAIQYPPEVYTSN